MKHLLPLTLLFILTNQLVNAGTLYVDSSATDPTPDGSTWAKAYTTLQGALAAASSGDEIQVAEGIYYPDEGGSATDDDRSESFVISHANLSLLGGYPSGGGTRDPDAHPTILSGDIDQNDAVPFTGSNTNNAYNVVNVTNAAANATIDGFEITGGNANGAGLNAYGGGLWVGNVALLLTDCFVHTNTAKAGGGLYCDSNSNHILSVRSCRFERNSATAAANENLTGGGAIYINVASDGVVTNSSFRGNQSIGRGGAAAAYTASASLQFTNCLFQGNYSQTASAAVRFNGDVIPVIPVQDSMVINCTFQGNRTPGSIGSFSGVVRKIHNTIIWDNSPNDLPSTTSIADYQNSLIANSSGEANPELLDIDPLFNDPIDPATAPSALGDLNLQGSSPAIGAGDDTLNGEALDLAGNARFVPLGMDLGAYEFDKLDVEIDSALISPVIAEESADLPAWAPDTTAWNSGNGLEYIFTPISTVGNLSFSTPPAIAPNGDLSFDIASGEGGFATFSVVLNDPSGTFQDSLPMILTIRVRGFAFKCDPTATGSNDGLSWVDALTNLDTALATVLEGDQLWVAQGTYIPASSFDISQPVDIYGGFPVGGGDGTFAARSSDPSLTILSGDIDQDGDLSWPDSDNAQHVVTAQASSGGFLLDGFTIERGNASGAGGGMLVLSTEPPTLRNLIFRHNHAASSGGALYLAEDCEITDCLFTENSADRGGAIFIASMVTGQLRNSLLQGNSAADGGALHFADDANGFTLTNCSIQGNSATRRGGGINVAAGVCPNLINTTLQGNSAALSGGGIFVSSESADASPNFSNLLIWNNSEGGVTNTANASMKVPSFGKPVYSHCLIENYSKATLDTNSGGQNNNLTPSDPLFANPVPPGSAPSTGSDLRLLTGSPALEAGDDSLNAEPTDLAGNDRKIGTIDLGAYEGAFVTFAHLGYTNPTGDDNSNGITNFGDYAAGGDPTANDDSTLRPSINGDQVSLSYRNNAADVDVDLEKSDTLAVDSWTSMIETIDYNVSTITKNGTQTIYTIELLTDPVTETKMFYRQVFSTSP